MIPLLLVVFTLTGAADAQDTWVVTCQLNLAEIADPGNFVEDFAMLTDQPKVASYPDLLNILSQDVGDAHVAYTKDADPYGQFELTVVNNLAGGLTAYCIVDHTIEPVVGAGWTVQCWLDIELIDDGGDVWLRTDAGQVLMQMFVKNESGTWVPVFGMALGGDLDLVEAGIEHLDTGVLVYGGPEAQAMQAIIAFDLSGNDQAVITGRFEISQDLTPVEARTWSGVKGLFH